MKMRVYVVAYRVDWKDIWGSVQFPEDALLSISAESLRSWGDQEGRRVSARSKNKCCEAKNSPVFPHTE